MKQKIRFLLLFFMTIIFVVTLSFAVLSVGQVITAFADSSYSGPLKVSSLEIIENTLTLKIKQPFTGVAEDIMVSWGFIVEIDKSVVSGVTNSKYLVFSI